MTIWQQYPTVFGSGVISATFTPLISQPKRITLFIMLCNWQHKKMITFKIILTSFKFVFRFSSTEWPNGHYVHTLAGFKEEPMSYHYWLLYKLPELPKVTSPPQNRFVAPVGVDELLIEDGDHYLFWYKKL